MGAVVMTDVGTGLGGASSSGSSALGSRDRGESGGECFSATGEDFSGVEGELSPHAAVEREQ